MFKRYTNSDLEEFFRLSKNMPVVYSIEKVEKLINAAPTGKVIKQIVLSSKLKFIIMSTSIVSIILIGLLHFFSFGHPESTYVKPAEKLPLQQTETGLQQHSSSENTFTPPQAHHHLASADTVFDGEALLVNLSVEELTNLGFVFNDTGMYYKNYYQGEFSFFKNFVNGGVGGTNGLIENSNTHLPVHSDNNFYPLYITNNNYDIYWEPIRKRENFDLLNDTLVPVRITEEQSKYNSDLIFWFIATPDLFKHLPSKYSYLEEKYNSIKEIKKRGSEKNLVKFVPVPVITASHYIELSQTELEKLGFIFTDDAVSYIFTLSNDVFKLSLNDGNHMEMGQNEKWGFDNAILNFNQKDDSKLKSPFKLYFISDSYGNKPFTWIIKPGDEIKLKSSYFQKKIDYLVPIVIHKKDYPVLRTDFIFWFEPNQALFDSLPGNMGKVMEREYKYITTPAEQQKEAPECEYFNVCHAPLYKDFKVFPNPLNALARINFTAEHTTVGRIELLDINGKKLKTLTSHLNIEKGMNSCEIDLCDRAPGIYMLVLVTKQGYQAQRVIVAR